MNWHTTLPWLVLILGSTVVGCSKNGEIEARAVPPAQQQAPPGPSASSEALIKPDRKTAIHTGSAFVDTSSGKASPIDGVWARGSAWGYKRERINAVFVGLQAHQGDPDDRRIVMDLKLMLGDSSTATVSLTPFTVLLVPEGDHLLRVLPNTSLSSQVEIAEYFDRVCREYLQNGRRGRITGHIEGEESPDPGGEYADEILIWPWIK